MIGGWLGPIADAVARNRLSLVCSVELLEELSQTLSRKRIARFVQPPLADRVRDLYLQTGEFFEAGDAARVCRDESDDYLLALALVSRADYLVTRDADLLVLEEYRGTRIIYPAHFLQIICAADQAGPG